jgi:hypothetical protein
MKSAELLEKLRELYREGKFEDLRKAYLLGAWMLTKEDRLKIEHVIGIKTQDKEAGDKLIQDAIEIFNAKIIK